MSLTVAVFSYNRGAYLQNCLASIERNMPFAKIVIYDDGSTDAATTAVLAKTRHPVYRPESADRSKHGGLYRNMQAALDSCDSDYLFFLQEDMQVTRAVSADDILSISRLFAADSNRAFVHPLFMKASKLRRFQRHLRPDPALRAYLGPNRQAADWSNRIAYYDVCIAHIGRLRAAAWRFAGTEHANVLAARDHFSDMPFLGDPFAFYCPEVPIFRNRGQSFAARLAARITGTDVKAFHDLDAEHRQRLLNRPISDWPIAETWLQPLSSKVRKPFVYKDVKARWWLNLLHKAEQGLFKSK